MFVYISLSPWWQLEHSVKTSASYFPSYSWYITDNLLHWRTRSLQTMGCWAKVLEKRCMAIVWIDCNGILVHYMWLSLRKVYACSPYKSTPPIPETVCTYIWWQKCVRHATCNKVYIVQFLRDEKFFLICQLRTMNCFGEGAEYIYTIIKHVRFCYWLYIYIY